jgi:hypothetical protein
MIVGPWDWVEMDEIRLTLHFYTRV